MVEPNQGSTSLTIQNSQVSEEVKQEATTEESNASYSSDSVNKENELLPGQLGCKHYLRACML